MPAQELKVSESTWVYAVRLRADFWPAAAFSVLLMRGDCCSACGWSSLSGSSTNFSTFDRLRDGSRGICGMHTSQAGRRVGGGEQISADKRSVAG